VSAWLIAISGAMYAYVAVDLGWFGSRPGLGLMYFGYFIGAIGACWEALR
jgi:hypothetical protein